ncbi:adenylyl-sulfate kinase [Fulvivirga sp. M361]|uniref:adenylyl-sulfate kinase n=1 Tax=Fulvivirga sp. M361 TaxID=2594266 RepID=UPI00117A257B|nr:adenylyl-sulfate kinase [Fulvivirga sp. M361]TRX51633.1 adenylyl-sulfate kinase [Fulvivirga sp. M361]
MAENIHPIFDSILKTEQKEALLEQQSQVIWMVGLSGSGKSTLARALENSLHEKGILTALLDGDNLRTGINNNLGFSEEERTENIRRAAETAKLLAANGVVTICSLISPLESIRSMAKSIIGDKYYEVFIDCPLDICESRDVKGLYAKARKGLIKNFTGIDSPFEPPKQADLIVKTGEQGLEESLNEMLEKILPIVKLN